MWDLPGPGIEPVFPALAGGFLTTEPPGKPHIYLFIFKTTNQLEKELWRWVESTGWESVRLSPNPCSISLIDNCVTLVSYHTSLSLSIFIWKMEAGLRNTLNDTNFYETNHEMLFGGTFTWHAPSKILPHTLSVAPPSGVLQGKQESCTCILIESCNADFFLDPS